MESFENADNGEVSSNIEQLFIPFLYAKHRSSNTAQIIRFYPGGELEETGRTLPFA